MDIFLGSKEALGVEVKIMEKNEKGTLLGYGRIWLGGHFIGTMEELIYLNSYLLGGLYQLMQAGEMKDAGFPTSKEDQYRWFVAKAQDMNDDSYDSYLVNFGTFTDRFERWAYRQGEEVTLLWKIDTRENEYMPKDLLDYPKEVFRYSAKQAKFKELARWLDRILKDWEGPFGQKD